MVLCKEDKINNPITNKCVSIKGVAGKMLIKQFIDGKIVLAPENVKKIGKDNTPSIVKKTIVKKSATETTPSVKKTIVKKSATETKPFVKKTVVKKSATPLDKEEISKQTKDKVHNFIVAWRKAKERKITEQDYSLYCKTKNIEDLKKPIVNMTMSIEFPVASMNTLGFFPESLDNPKQKFIYNKITGIQISFNNYSLRHLLYKGQNDTVKYFEDLVDKTWLKQMNQYISDLPTRDIYTLIAYTHYGDVIANNFMRKKLTKANFIKDIYSIDKWFTSFYPLFFQAIEKIEAAEKTNKLVSILKDGKDIMITIPDLQGPSSKVLSGKMLGSEFLKKLVTIKSLKNSDKYRALYTFSKNLGYDEFWQDVIRLYITDLDNLINKSPPTTKKMIVYRGVKNDYYLNGIKDHIYKTDSFVSTSINLPSALRFAGTDCCFKRITLLPGTKTLLLAGISKYKNEIELLLGTNAQFYITKDKNTIPKSTTDMCNDLPSGKITVTDLVVIK